MNARRIRDGVFALVIGFGLGTAVIEADSLRTLLRSGQRLGDVDFFQYCDTRYGETATATLNGDDAAAWRCVVRDPIFAFTSINVDDACTRQWDVPAEARSDDLESAYSWQCYVK